MASAGALDDQEHRGFLGWVIERTDESEKGNLELDQATWSADVSLKLPGGKKRRHSVALPEASLASLPIIVNPKPLQAHTRLFLFFISSKSGKDLQSPDEKPAKKGGKKTAGAAGSAGTS